MGVDNGVEANNGLSSTSLEAGVTAWELEGLGVDVHVPECRFGVEIGAEKILFLLADLNALSPLGVRSFLGDANLLPTLSDGS